MPEDATQTTIRDLTNREVAVLKFIAGKPRGVNHDEVAANFKTFAIAEHMDDLMNRFRLIEPLSDGHGGSKGRYIASEAGRAHLKRLAAGEAQTISQEQAFQLDTRRDEAEAAVDAAEEGGGEPIETGVEGQHPTLSNIPPAPGPNMIYDAGTRRWLTHAEAAQIFQAKAVPAAAPVVTPKAPTAPPAVSKTGRAKPPAAKKKGAK